MRPRDYDCHASPTGGRAANGGACTGTPEAAVPGSGSAGGGTDTRVSEALVKLGGFGAFFPKVTDREAVEQIFKEQSGVQSSWDWTADTQFARLTGGDEETVKTLQAAVDSNAPDAFRMGAMDTLATPFKRRRLAALRRMEKEGLVQASWAGIGAGGRERFGVSRVRQYRRVYA